MEHLTTDWKGNAQCGWAWGAYPPHGEGIHSKGREIKGCWERTMKECACGAVGVGGVLRMHSLLREGTAQVPDPLGQA